MESFTTEDGKYRIESMSAATIPGALKALKEDFFQDEAVSIGTEMDKNPLAVEELLEFCADAALDGLSLVAVATDSGEVVATVFNKIQVAPSDSSEISYFEIFTKERCKQPSSRATMELMIELDNQCDFFKRYNIDCTFELTFVGTRREHRRKGLAKLLCKTSVELAKKLKYGPVAPLTVQDLGPKYAFMAPREPITKVPKLCHGLWSSIGTQKIGESLGFDELLRVSFKDFTFNGKSYAERIGFDPYCICGAKRID